MTETSLLKSIQVALSQLGARIFRNNTGKLKDSTGRWVSFGLCNGSSDLIGWTEVKITDKMVGATVAIFTALEVKIPGGRRTEEQENFIKCVNKSGGIGAFVSSEEEAEKILRSMQKRD